ncbi:Rossmann-fold NAD(P)-binding domain-containing protein [Nocardia farcinica]|uniref:hypothetical protein n=1 Tax=Nocardia farcinica TaxID=37329 RepID=UPI001894F6E7|nr:hypothetical protein [Nocardia farcinica]MBF6574106.1 hypothetical protein [Nocardia farcinica]
MRCAFIDTSLWPAQEIGAVHEQLAHEIDCPAAGFILHTCQRVEVYTLTGHAALPGPAGAVVGHAAVARRLTEIAAGVRSRVLGERFVLHQVAAAGQRTNDHRWIEVVEGAVRVAAALRGDYRLDAVLDYPAAALRLLTEHRCSRPRWLVVVGGGMLARAIAAHATGRYSHVVLVTRCPKRARRRLGTLAAGVAVGTAAAAAAMLETARAQWDAVLATTRLDESYRGQIAALVEGSGCRSAVDLCAAPLRRDCTESYQHMYGRRFASLIDEQNAAVADRVELVRAAIAAVYGED